MNFASLRVDAVESTPGALRGAVHFLRVRGHAVQLEGWDAAPWEQADVRVVELPEDVTLSLERLKQIAQRDRYTRTVLVGPHGLANLADAVGFGHAFWLYRPIDLDQLIDVIEETQDGGLCSGMPFEREYPARKESVERAARDLIAWALRSRVTPAARARIATACAEVFDNVCRHAYPTESRTAPQSADETLRVEAQLDERELVVTVSDRGAGFCSSEIARTSSRDGGLARASALSEGLRIETAPNSGSRVRLTFAVSSVHLSGERSLDLSDLDFLLPQDARLLLEACSRAGGAEEFHLSPALAVALGRLLAGPDSRRALQTALSS